MQIIRQYRNILKTFIINDILFSINQQNLELDSADKLTLYSKLYLKVFIYVQL
jgi:hypothetical protein